MYSIVGTGITSFPLKKVRTTTWICVMKVLSYFDTSKVRVLEGFSLFLIPFSSIYHAKSLIHR